jgi:hypothetical protein
MRGHIVRKPKALAGSFSGELWIPNRIILYALFVRIGENITRHERFAKTQIYVEFIYDYGGDKRRD